MHIVPLQIMWMKQSFAEDNPRYDCSCGNKWKRRCEYIPDTTKQPLNACAFGGAS